MINSLQRGLISGIPVKKKMEHLMKYGFSLLSIIAVIGLTACFNEGLNAQSLKANDPITRNSSEPQTLAVEQTIAVAKASHYYFLGDDNKRNIEYTAKLPESIDGYGRILLHLKLSCPSGKCDVWDRIGWFGVVSKLHEGAFFELVRFATPYGVGGEWTVDVTDFAPLLTGDQTFKGFIDTWVGPGNPAGNGWLVDVSFQYTPGTLAEKTVLIAPINLNADIVYGDPNQPTARSADLPPMLGYTSAKIYTLITGHGQGNSDNCAEFCPRTHSFEVGGRSVKKEIWRNDCDKNPISNQGGSWKYPRAGWCPGDIVRPWVEDITSLAQSGSPKITYDVQAYDNTCRPGSNPCANCVLGTGCEYDGGRHTEPRFYVTSYVFYKK
ncbi:MAG: hypothetical protein EOP09_08725 [Proteobacteria bacterium]|nr:MAG: hypothetical protein EOP09_08725 [Pseudomonadota bacterium]